MSQTMNSDRLPTHTKLLYGVGDVGNAVVNSAVQFFLLVFYTDAALIAPALAGSAMLIGKVVDAAIDPFLGWLGDRTPSTRFGRRRVYMIAGALPLAVAIALLWRAPAGVGTQGQFIWIAATYTIFSIIWSATNVPYYALTTELTEDYDERSSLTSFRMVIAVPAYLVGAALTPALVGLFASKRSGYGAVGIIYGVVAAVALLVCAAGVREKAQVTASRASTAAVRTLKQIFANSFFVRLIIAYSIVNIAFGFSKTLMAYYLTYQMGMGDQVPVAMGLMLVAVAAALFPWMKVSQRWNKGPAYALGLSIGALAVTASFFLTPGQEGWVYAIFILAGVGFSAQWVFPWSMVPDVVDYDRLNTREYRSGVYFGVWSFLSSVTEAFAAAGAGWVLGIFGYVPNVTQSASTLFGIRLFFGPLPAAIILVALPMLVWYPLTRQKHRQIMAQIEASELRGAEFSTDASASLPGSIPDAPAHL